MQEFMVQVTFIYGDQKKTVQGKNGQTLLQIGLDNGVPIERRDEKPQ